MGKGSSEAFIDVLSSIALLSYQCHLSNHVPLFFTPVIRSGLQYHILKFLKKLKHTIVLLDQLL